jgi:hypothetical protein
LTTSLFDHIMLKEAVEIAGTYPWGGYDTSGN